MKFGNITIGGMSFGSTRIGGAKFGNTLVFQPGGNLPYTPVAYIETDGDAYINTGITGNAGRSCELKFEAGSLTGTRQCILGTETGNENTSLFVLVDVGSGGSLGFGYRYFYNNPDFPITAQSPFDVKCAMKRSSQVLQLKYSGESSFSSYSKTQSNTITTNMPMYLFAGNNANTSVVDKCSQASRLYYCKIYSDDSYTTLVFDGVPCYYNGEYGLWDRVSGTFFGNAAGSGAFTGPSIS